LINKDGQLRFVYEVKNLKEEDDFELIKNRINAKMTDEVKKFALKKIIEER
jgi:hypothetical protein